MNHRMFEQATYAYMVRLRQRLLERFLLLKSLGFALEVGEKLEEIY